MGIRRRNDEGKPGQDMPGYKTIEALYFLMTAS
jgi:hypothetical protein